LQPRSSCTDASRSAESASEHMFSGANFIQIAALKQQLLGKVAKKTHNRQEKETTSSLGAKEVLRSVAGRFWLLLKQQVCALVLETGRRSVSSNENPLKGMHMTLVGRMLR